MDKKGDEDGRKTRHITSLTKDFAENWRKYLTCKSKLSNIWI